MSAILADILQAWNDGFISWRIKLVKSDFLTKKWLMIVTWPERNLVEQEISTSFSWHSTILKGICHTFLLKRKFCWICSIKTPLWIYDFKRASQVTLKYLASRHNNFRSLGSSKTPNNPFKPTITPWTPICQWKSHGQKIFIFNPFFSSRRE